MRHANNRNGSALGMTMALVVILMTVAAVMMDLTANSYNHSQGRMAVGDAGNNSEDGWRLALDMLNKYKLDPTLEEPSYFQSEDGAELVRIDLPGDNYYLFEIRDDGDPGNTGTPADTKIIRATGFVDGYTRSLEIVARNTEDLKQVFANAIYAGNQSGTPGYAFALGGDGSSADIVTGSIFANGDIHMNGDSAAAYAGGMSDGDTMSVAGQTVTMRVDEDRKARATGDVTAEGDLDETYADPFSGMQDAPITRADINAVLAAYADQVVRVNDEFQAHEVAAKYASSSAHFSNSTHRNNFWNEYRTYVIDNDDNPAHIFTHGKQLSTGYDGSNDDTIGSSISGSTPPAHPNAGANTFHLLDPFDTSASTGRASAYGQDVTLSGGAAQGATKIYYIQGDLWIHDHNAFDLQLQHEGPDGAKIAFIVEGDIFFSDNIFWGDAQNDMFMFMALKKADDPDGEHSGNIHLGDPQFGTVEELDALLYAENNFVENNLGASGSAEFVINGNMTAGNLVDVNRDYGSEHSKMVVNYESRLTGQSQADVNFRDGMPAWMKAIMFHASAGATRNFVPIAFRNDHRMRLRPEQAEVTWTREAILNDIRQHNETVELLDQ